MATTILNDDCLYTIFEMLDIADCMNIAETCKHFGAVMNLLFHTKFAVFKTTATMQDEKFTDRILYHVGKHMKALSIGSDDKSGYALTKLGACDNVKKLFLRNWKLNLERFSSEATDFRHIESLSMFQCDLRLNREFFAQFSNIETVNFSFCRRIHNKSLIKFFQKNDKIKSFAFQCNSFNKFPLGSLALLPNLERVHFLGLIDSPEYLKQLSQLKSLKKLKLWTRHLNRNKINDALPDLEFLEELEIRNFEINEKFFSSIQHFKKLKLFNLMFPRIFLWQWESIFILPSNITSLKLEGVHISVKQIATIIRDLTKLKRFVICPHEQAITRDNSMVKIDDFEETVRSIYVALTSEDSLRLVYVILFDAKYSTEVGICSFTLPV